MCIHIFTLCPKIDEFEVDLKRNSIVGQDMNIQVHTLLPINDLVKAQLGFWKLKWLRTLLNAYIAYGCSVLIENA